MLHLWQNWQGCTRLLLVSMSSIPAAGYAYNNMCGQFYSSCFLESWLFAKKRSPQKMSPYSWQTHSVGDPNPQSFSLTTGSDPLGHIANRIWDRKDYSWIIKTTSSVHFTTVHANLIELVVLKRRIIVDSTCLLLHRLEQHRRILLSKETYRTLAQPADPCGNHFGDMMWKIPNPTWM